MHTRVSGTTDPSLFDGALKELLAQDKILLVYVVGARDEHGKSWCPDCVASDPILDEALSTFNKPTIVFEAPVARAEYKGNPNYPYRKHPQIQLTGVPTLVHWTKEGPQARLVEHDITKENTEKFLKSL